jgi:uncharacterized membrane protein YdbT with pleckstrin-like domain
VVRLVPSGDTNTAPGSVSRYLLPYERHVISVRQHPVMLAGRALAVLAGLGVAGWLSASLTKENTAILLIIWILWGVLLAWLVAKIIDWWVYHFVVTSKRLLLTTGVWLRTVNAIPLDKVTDIEFRQSQTGKLFSYGTLEVFAQNQNPRMKTFRYLPYPGQLYLEVSGLIFKE